MRSRHGDTAPRGGQNGGLASALPGAIVASHGFAFGGFELSSPDPLDVAIGASIRHRRQDLGLSQVALSTRCGLKFQQLQKYERGQNRISFSGLVRVAQGLECRVADLVGDIDGVEGLSGAQTDALAFLSTPGAAELLRGYARLPDPDQRAILQLVRALDQDGGIKRPVVVSVFPSTVL